MSRHHKLDVFPVPERALYINETDIADITAYDVPDDNKYRTEEEWQTKEFSQEDNVRIYVPLDLNKSAILRRLWRIGYQLGDPTEYNELAYWEEVQRIISQLEIYDQVWCTREGTFHDELDEHFHSMHGRELVEAILEQLEKWEENSSAECFPYDEIDDLEDSYLISKEHPWK